MGTTIKRACATMASWCGAGPRTTENVYSAATPPWLISFSLGETAGEFVGRASAFPEAVLHWRVSTANAEEAAPEWTGFWSAVTPPINQVPLP